MDRKRIKSEDNLEINKIVGANLRFIRQLAGKNQTKLGDAIGGVRFQQVQKYEDGRNSMTAFRLWKAAKFFNVPMEAFFDPDYIKKMRAIHETKFFNKGSIKPKDFFNVYSYEKELDDQLHTDLYQDKIKGRELTPQEEKFLEAFDGKDY